MMPLWLLKNAKVNTFRYPSDDYIFLCSLRVNLPGIISSPSLYHVVIFFFHIISINSLEHILMIYSHEQPTSNVEPSSYMSNVEPFFLPSGELAGVRATLDGLTDDVNALRHENDDLATRLGTEVRRNKELQREQSSLAQGRGGGVGSSSRMGGLEPSLVGQHDSTCV